MIFNVKFWGKLFVAIYFCFSLLKCMHEEKERHQSNASERTAQPSIQQRKHNGSQEARPFSGGATGSYSDSEDDSLRRLYDKNSPEYHYHNEYGEYNADDDDALWQYYNDDEEDEESEEEYYID